MESGLHKLTLDSGTTSDRVESSPANAKRPAKLWIDKNVARWALPTSGAIAAFIGAVINARGTVRNNTRATTQKWSVNPIARIVKI